MTTVTAFCDMMEQFCDELIQTFPDEKSFKRYKVTVEMSRKVNPRRIVNTYMDSLSPYAQKLMAKDETFILDDGKNIETISDLNISNIWTADLSENTKNAIWQYLQTLYILGTTISLLPQDTLNMIESVAKQCVDQIGEGDLQSSIANLSNLLGKNPPKV